MNRDNKPENHSNSETQRAENIAKKFSDLADKERQEERKYPKEDRFYEDVYSGVGRETAQGNFHGAQRILESSVKWNDDLRGSASEINRLDQERKGAKPMSLEDAQNGISGYARELEELSKKPGGRPQDLENAMAIDNMAADIKEPGVEGIDNALKYIEGLLKSKHNIADSILKSKGEMRKLTSEFLKDWEEKRAIRDAMYQEKQRRVEQMKQTQRGTENLAKGREESTKMLENLFGQASIPEDMPWRQEFSARVGRMADTELYFLRDAMKKIMAKFARTGRTQEDTDRLEARLSELSTMSFSLSAVEKRQKDEDARNIEDVRRKNGLPEQRSGTPKGRTDAEIEAMRQKVEKMMPAESKERNNESVKPKTETREAKNNRPAEKVQNPFQSFSDSPETYLNQLDDVKDLNTYSPKKAIGAVMEMLQKLYPDRIKRANRIQEILGQYDQLIVEGRKKRPDANEFSREAFATNQAAQRLLEAEQQELEKIIKKNLNTAPRNFVGAGTMKYSKEYVLGSFIQFIDKL